jgi:beta-lactamase class A
VSARVTTAADLGRVLVSMHRAAAGDRAVLRRLGLTAHQARVGLALLLATEPVGDNVGLFREALPPGTLVAHKNGWLGRARHDAAILYRRGAAPLVVVLLTYRDGGLRRAQAAALGRQVLRTVGWEPA